MKRLSIIALLLLCCLPLQAQVSAMRRNAEKSASALFYIQTRYVDSVDFDKAVDAMMMGLMEQLDPHST